MMFFLSLFSGPIPEPIGPFGHLNLDEGLIFISIVIAVAVIGFRKMNGKSTHLSSRATTNLEETYMTNSDVLIQPKQILSSEYVENNQLPFSSIKKTNGFIWTLLLFVLMAFLQGFLTN